MEKMTLYKRLYNELRHISEELLQYYDIDKVKPYSVYVWNKEETAEGKEILSPFDGCNLFDIQADQIIVYENEHKIIEEAKPIIKRIQAKLVEIELSNR